VTTGTLNKGSFPEPEVNTMKSKLTMGLLASAVFVARAETNSAPIRPDRISLYEVPLVCPAAPEIGCGSRSKPILLQLEREKSVDEAWLNRQGTLLVIVWKPETKPKERTATFKSVTEKEELKARELSGAARDKALKDFLSHEGWHRGGDVDRLSEEEAGIMAARLVRRIQAKVSISDEIAKTLQGEFTELFKRRLTGQDVNDSTSEERVRGILSSHLSAKDVTLLEDTLPHNLRPLPGEK
jgi:hypothetical protein